MKLIGIFKYERKKVIRIWNPTGILDTIARKFYASELAFEILLVFLTL